MKQEKTTVCVNALEVAFACHVQWGLPREGKYPMKVSLRHTHRQTGLILLPRPLMQEVKSASLQMKRLSCGTKTSHQEISTNQSRVASLFSSCHIRPSSIVMVTRLVSCLTSDVLNSACHLCHNYGHNA